MIAIVFSLTHLERGLQGFALLAPEARYCSTCRPGADQLGRRFFSPAQWRAIESELKDRLPTTPLPSTSAIARALSDSPSSVIAQYVHQSLIDARPGETAVALDRQLRLITMGRG